MGSLELESSLQPAASSEGGLNSLPLRHVGLDIMAHARADILKCGPQGVCLSDWSPRAHSPSFYLLCWSCPCFTEDLLWYWTRAFRRSLTDHHWIYRAPIMRCHVIFHGRECHTRGWLAGHVSPMRMAYRRLNLSGSWIRLKLFESYLSKTPCKLSSLHKLCHQPVLYCPVFFASRVACGREENQMNPSGRQSGFQTQVLYVTVV